VGATFVVDASVVVAVLAHRRDSADSERFIQGLRWPDPITLLAPDLLFLETANALRKLTLRREISKAKGDDAAKALGLMPIAAVPCSSLVEGAWALSPTVTAYDAAYLSLAREMDVPYVTRDARAKKAADQLGIPAWHVSDPELSRMLDTLEPRIPGRG
jgi:predicted nucleic acid-binding protein